MIQLCRESQQVENIATEGLTVVVPVYRSEAILPELVRRLGDVLSRISSNCELILVNDSSPDRSWEVIGQLRQQCPWIHGINLMRNYGQHNALFPYSGLLQTIPQFP